MVACKCCQSRRELFSIKHISSQSECEVAVQLEPQPHRARRLGASTEQYVTSHILYKAVFNSRYSGCDANREVQVIDY